MTPMTYTYIYIFLWTQRAQRIHLRDDKPSGNSSVRRRGLRAFGSKDHSIGQREQFKAVALTLHQTSMNPVHYPTACSSNSSLFLFSALSWILLILQLSCLVGQFLHRCLGDEDVAMRLLPLFKEELLTQQIIGKNQVR